MPTNLEISKLHFKSYPSLSQSLLQHSQRGRVIVITGGARGIGLSIAQAFASSDALSVHLLGRTASSLLSAKNDLGGQHTSCKIYTYAVDVANEGAVNEAFESIKHSTLEEFEVGECILVHSAAFLPLPEDLDQISQGGRMGGWEWWKAFEINAKGTFLVFQAFSNLVRAVSPNCMGSRDDKPDPPRTTTGNEAVIINLVSASAYAFTAPGTSAYAASKLAAIRIMEFAAYEGITKSHRTRIVNLHPGAVKTDMWEKSGGESVGIPCNDDDLVPQFVLWLTTPLAQFLHGRTVEANWDIDELLAQKELIVAENLLTTTLRGYPFDNAEKWDVVVQESLLREADAP